MSEVRAVFYDAGSCVAFMAEHAGCSMKLEHNGRMVVTLAPPGPEQGAEERGHPSAHRGRHHSVCGRDQVMPGASSEEYICIGSLEHPELPPGKHDIYVRNPCAPLGAEALNG